MNMIIIMKSQMK